MRFLGAIFLIAAVAAAVAYWSDAIEHPAHSAGKGSFQSDAGVVVAAMFGLALLCFAISTAARKRHDRRATPEYWSKKKK